MTTVLGGLAGCLAKNALSSATLRQGLPEKNCVSNSRVVEGVRGDEIICDSRYRKRPRLLISNVDGSAVACILRSIAPRPSGYHPTRRAKGKDGRLGGRIDWIGLDKFNTRACLLVLTRPRGNTLEMESPRHVLSVFLETYLICS